MKKFNFNMNTLLMVREKREESAQKDLQEARTLLEKLLKIVQELHAESDSLMKELKLKKTFTIHDLSTHVLYLQALKGRISRYEDEILKAHNIVENRRQALVKALRDKKIIENIKEKQYSEWKEYFIKMEIKLADEMATIRHIRAKDRQ